MSEDTNHDSEDRVIVCIDCRQPFNWPRDASPHFVQLVREKNWPLPIRCKACSLAGKQRVRDAARALPAVVTVECRSCGGPFQLTAREIAWWRDKSLELPVHCEHCRRERRDAGPGVARALSAAEHLAE